MRLQKMPKALEYIHAALILALIIPLIYGLVELSEPNGAVVLYIKCFLIIIPVILTDVAVKRIKSLSIYIVICGAVLAAVWFLAVMLPNIMSGGKPLETYQVTYSTVLIIETLLISFMRLKDRLKEAEFYKSGDIYTEKEVSFINKPSSAFIWYFVVVYAVGIFFNSKTLCDISFVSAIVYFFVALAYGFLTSMADYLKLNKDTKGIPRKRLYGISTAITGIFAAFILVGMIPSMLLANSRYYTDVRKWSNETEIGPYAIEMPETQSEGISEMDAIGMMFDGEPAPEPSKLVNAICQAAAVVILLFIAYGMIKTLRQIFKEFRSSMDENGDKVEELVIDDENGDIIASLKRRRDNTETESIRRKYRKTIRKYRKDTPAPYESPEEIEKNAGIFGRDFMEKLHIKYEDVRYGRGKL